MQQASNPVLPPRDDQLNSPITTEERLEILQKSTKDAVLKANGKKDLLNSYIPLRSSILEKAAVFDTCNNSTMVSSLSISLPAGKKEIKEKNNKELSNAILELYDAFVMLQKHLADQHKQIVARSLRTKRSKDSVLLLLDDYFELLEKVDKQAIGTRHSNIDPSLKTVTLTNFQRQRRWSKERVPVAPSLQLCVMCGLQSTNEPEENENVIEHNDIVLKDYVAKLKVWSDYEAKKFKTVTAVRKPSGMKRKPQRGKFLQPIIQCMCSTSSCMMEGTDINSSCPIKCIDPATEERYPFIGTGSDRHCSCPICLSKCSFACKIDDVPKFLITTRAIPPTTEKSDDKKNLGAASSAFLSSVFENAVESRFKKMRDDIDSENMLNHGKKSSKKVYENVIQRGKNGIAQEASTHIAKFGNQKLNHEEINFLRNQIGRPSTKVVLPNGANFDTRYIMSDGQHGKNNRLGTTSTKPIHPGMKSNLKVDFEGASDNYINAVASVSANKKTTSYNTIYVDELNGTMVGNKIYLSDSSESKKSHSSFSSVEVLDPKTAKVEEMHNRVLNHSRTMLSDSLNKRRKQNTEELKNECKSVKKTLTKLEESEKNGTHLNIMKGVTKNGDLLVNSPVLMSPDVYELLELYHDDE